MSPGGQGVPVAIGGVGGSGTRLIARMLGQLGWYLGDDLNESVDNLWFTLLFKRTELWPGLGADDEFALAAETFRAAMSGGPELTAEQQAWVRGLAADRPQHDRAWLAARVDSLLASTRRRERRPGPWGWKEPNTHVFLDRLAVAYPDMKYIHVMRNGLDMAHSANQNQLKLWGPLFLGAPVEPGPRSALKYWCTVHQRITRIGSQMPGRFMMLHYDALCRQPAGQLASLMDFLGVSPSPSVAASMLALVRPPGSVGRFRTYGPGTFDAADIEYVRSLGFEVGSWESETRP